MQQPLSLMQHLHWKIAKSKFDDVLQLPNRDFLDTLSALLILNLARKQAPKNLRNQLLVLGG
jgi:hypothetical protein